MHMEINAPYRPYNGEGIGVQIGEEGELILYRAYAFRQHLSAHGFWWDDARKAWIGEYNPKLFSGHIGKRLWESISYRGREKILGLVRSTSCG